MADHHIRPADLAELMKSLATETREFVQQAVAPLAARLDEITKRIAALEQADRHGEGGAS